MGISSKRAFLHATTAMARVLDYIEIVRLLESLNIDGMVKNNYVPR